MSEPIVSACAPAVKACRQCGAIKPFDDFYPSRGTKSSKTGRTAKCKACHSANWKAIHPRRPKVVETEHRCTGCGTVKPLSDFNRRGDGGLVNPRCKACRVIERRENREQTAIANAAYRETHRDECAVRSAKYYRENKVRLRGLQVEYNKANRERLKECRREWSRTHRAERNAHHAKRRALKRSATIGDLELIKEFYKAVREAKRIRCHWCNRLVPKGSRHVDHIIPLDKGGAHAEWNLTCSCSKCNCKKHAKMPEEFAGQAYLDFCKANASVQPKSKAG